MPPVTVTKVSSFRQRGYRNKTNQNVQIVYASDPAPVSPDASGDEWVQEWDSWLTQTEVSAPYADQDVPAPSSDSTG